MGQVRVKLAPEHSVQKKYQAAQKHKVSLIGSGTRTLGLRLEPLGTRP